jgi:hypothetical protein
LEPDIDLIKSTRSGVQFTAPKAFLCGEAGQQYKLDREEEHAIREIEAAIGEIKHAAIDDGKDLNDHPPVDAHLDHKGRYHKAIELLDRAHHDVAEKEDDKYAHGLRHRALEHIEEAKQIVDRLIIQTSRN